MLKNVCTIIIIHSVHAHISLLVKHAVVKQPVVKKVVAEHSVVDPFPNSCHLFSIEIVLRATKNKRLL